MAASRTNVRLQQNLYDAFLRHRRGDYDSLLDENLKCGGEKILEENDPKNKYRINVHSIFWMTAAMLVFYYTDFYIAIKVDDRINRPWLYLGTALIGINVIVGLYFVVWCSYYKKVTDWDQESPALIPVATFSFISGLVCCTIALWPVWSFFTPFIIFTLFMGVVFLTTLIPL